MLKRAVCFGGGKVIALFLASYPAFAVEYEDLPPEIREYVDEVRSSAYDEGCEDGYEDGFYVGRMRGTRNMRKKMMLMRVSTILIPVRGEAARIIY